MKKNLFKKVIIFDLDGVLINTKSNMKFSWEKVQEKFNLNKTNFDQYFSKIGQPFYDILKQLGIKSKHKQIKECYDSHSVIKLKSIKFYPKIIKTLKKLKKNGFILCIVTSKDKIRTNLILKRYLNLFTVIQCPQKNIKGKPNGSSITKVIKFLKVSPNECIYVGDTIIDYLTSQNSGIDFLFVEWGYGTKSYLYKHSIRKIEMICKKIRLIPS